MQPAAPLGATFSELSLGKSLDRYAPKREFCSRGSAGLQPGTCRPEGRRYGISRPKALAKLAKVTTPPFLLDTSRDVIYSLVNHDVVEDALP